MLLILAIFIIIKVFRDYNIIEKLFDIVLPKGEMLYL